MLSRLNGTVLALATVSVFALGLVHPTSASAKSPVSGQGTGPMPPPSAPASATGGAKGNQNGKAGAGGSAANSGSSGKVNFFAANGAQGHIEK